ncbi:hypothetical protein [Bacillus badius]|uniref:IDEAL domain-containing protein n=1 Tax=Bacillus badius TaxID=1455 RepID=A0ABR5AXS7_BACBA|nr:hypothetical protein [Bacillus badius]KIL79552.1 hypothetical protein SD77_2006 [Bacillus badius]MED4718637.1 hypothetical protein [Bacillus badius]
MKESWVKIKNQKAIGFVLDSDYNNCMVYVIRDGKSEGEKRFSHHQVEPLDSELTSEDAATLKRLHINMALDTNDREWLKSLVEAEESK